MTLMCHQNDDTDQGFHCSSADVTEMKSNADRKAHPCKTRVGWAEVSEVSTAEYQLYVCATVLCGQLAPPTLQTEVFWPEEY